MFLMALTVQHDTTTERLSADPEPSAPVGARAAGGPTAPLTYLPVTPLGARCLDGSPYAFYHVPAARPSRSRGFDPNAKKAPPSAPSPEGEGRQAGAF